ncbi:transcriptional regulator, TetR family [Filimonas lacunae]|uniref:Transcriptional regulator, TetR family n=1 Tax=Filimonas lacunae TaxID=477680 RepID=A0A1N7RFB3_9BACT|nr:TetR/AcrR family transcriptional regulator [Filimonas lacunae]SIT33836.1 transcriptional regulator, TetR family [Filimonas lacunae]
MDKSLSKAERTRQFIIETASPLFNKKGYEGTSMSDITEATGLTKGSIYGNFANKEEIAIAVYDYNTDKILRHIGQRIAAETKYYDKLLVYTKIYDQVAGKVFPDGGCPILNTCVDADDTNPALKQRAARTIQQWKKQITDLVEAGIQAGEFTADIDPAQLALSMIALIEGGVMIYKITHSATSLDKILQTVEQLLKGIKKR